jgi:hypothetical protein
MNEAIKLAIENGYTRNGNSYPLEFFTEDPYERFRVVQEPLFWQALGKASGWGNDLWVGEMKRLVGDKLAKVKWEIPDWQHHAQIYFDILMEGGDTEKFWKELIK